MGCIMHGALATYKGTFVVKQISLSKLQTCISTILDPRQCLAMPASSRVKNLLTDARKAPRLENKSASLTRSYSALTCRGSRQTKPALMVSTLHPCSGLAQNSASSNPSSRRAQPKHSEDFHGVNAAREHRMRIRKVTLHQPWFYTDNAKMIQ